MRKRLAILSLAMVLAIGSVLAPFSRAAYANTVAIEAGAYALFTVLGLFGFNAGDDAISDPVTAWNEFTGWMDDLSADVVDEARAAARASNPDFINNALDWDAGGKEAIEAQFLDWGEQGTINLDGLSIMAQSGALGLIPFILSLYMADQVPASVDGQVFRFNAIDLSIPASTVADIPNGYTTYLAIGEYVLSDIPRILTASQISLHGSADTGYYLMPGTSADTGSTASNFAWNTKAKRFETIYVSTSILRAFFEDGFTRGSEADLKLRDLTTDKVLGGGQSIIIYDASTGAWNTDLGTLTDNPDVIGGSDYWHDAKENKDILNPAAGAAVIGADAVFDGDYIKNRGSIGVFSPADYADINSWADALARAHAGVAQGTLDGTISNTTTGTAVDVGTGELVTDTVGELTKPDGGHSTSKPKDPNGRDPNDWKIPIDLSKYFPFCIPFDIIALFEKLGSGASAFSFEPFDAPAFDAPFKVDGVIDENIHLDFADWSGMMANIRMLEFFVFLVGLAMVTRNIIRG